MSAKQNSALVLGGALIVGIVIGAAIGSRGGDEQRAMTKRIEALETQIAAQASAVENRLAELTSDSGAEDAMAALTARVDEMAAAAEAAASATDSGAEETIAAINDRVNQMANQMAGMIGRITDMAANAPEAASEAAQDGAEAVAGAATSAADAVSGAAESAGDAVASAAERLAGMIGDDGVALRVGQSADLGGTRIFLSRVGEEDARLFIPGRGAVDIGGGAEAVKLEDGCTLVLVGGAGRTAYLRPEC